MQASTRASERRAKVIRASHGPGVNLQSQAKERIKKIKENPKDYPKEPRVRTKVPKAHAEATRRKWDRLIMMTRRGFTRNGVLTEVTMAGVLTSGMGKDQPGHQSDCRHIPIELWPRRNTWTFLRLDSRW